MPNPDFLVLGVCFVLESIAVLGVFLYLGWRIDTLKHELDALKETRDVSQ